MNQIVNQEFTFSDGRVVSIETGKLARQANGSVLLRMGNMMLLATVVASKEPKTDIGFLPLYVDYQEKFAAAGRIPGGFLRREGRLNDSEVLISRLIDRAIRPLFPDNFLNEVQVFIQLISSDERILPDGYAAFAASCAIAISDIPLSALISEVRVAQYEGTFVINPSAEQVENATLNMIVAGTEKDITMVEGEMDEVPEATMIQAIQFAHEEIKRQCAFQKEFAQQVGEKEKIAPAVLEELPELQQRVQDEIYPKFYDVAKENYSQKQERSEIIDNIKETFLETVPEEEQGIAVRYLKKAQYSAFRKFVLDSKKRIDGRALNEIRNIECAIDYLPSTHGSALFTRGETQSLTSVTLGTKLDEQLIDNATLRSTSRFVLHYNFPAFSTGEVKPHRGPGRREIGHGNLAHRSLAKVMPEEINDLFTIRVVSDILESNGSSSMATVCAGSLALMDAGIRTKAAVSGIAMGMISDAETGEYAILSDILGDEDHLGDMDFKVTGTRKGITACQMDIKVDGLSFEILAQALEQAKQGRHHILQKMNEVIDAPRKSHKPNAPTAVVVRVPKDTIGEIIGPKGKHIQDLQEQTNTQITVDGDTPEEKAPVTIFGYDQKGIAKAQQAILNIIAVPEVGKVYNGIVKSVVKFGMFVEFLKGRDGLVHVSEIDRELSRNLEKNFPLGSRLKVKLLQVDPKTGKFRLTQKIK